MVSVDRAVFQDLLEITDQLVSQVQGVMQDVLELRVTLDKLAQPDHLDLGDPKEFLDVAGQLALWVMLVKQDQLAQLDPRERLAPTVKTGNKDRLGLKEHREIWVPQENKDLQENLVPEAWQATPAAVENVEVGVTPAKMVFQEKLVIKVARGDPDPREVVDKQDQLENEESPVTADKLVRQDQREKEV